MGVLYKLDSTRRNFGELWRIHRPNLLGFLAVAAHKLLGIPRYHAFAVRRPNSLHLHEPAEVPRPVRERLEGPIQACEGFDFALRFFATVDATVGGFVKAYMAALLHEEGRVWAVAITAMVWRGGNERVRPAHLTCFSRLPDGRYVVTSDHTWKSEPQPDDRPEFLAGASPEAVVARHFDRIDELEPEPVVVREGDLAGLILAREQRHVDYQVRRGVYVPMTAEEVERLTAR
jgi:hypothetical protein